MKAQLEAHAKGQAPWSSTPDGRRPLEAARALSFVIAFLLPLVLIPMFAAELRRNFDKFRSESRYNDRANGLTLMLQDPHVPPAVVASRAQDTAAVVRQLAHQLRQPLATIEQISSYLEIALPPADARSRRRLAQLQRELRRALWTLSDTAFYFDTAPRFALLDLKEVVSGALAEWHAGDTGWICVHSDDDLRPVRLDAAQIQHMLRTLVLFFAADPAARRATLVRTYAEGAAVVVEITAPDSRVPRELISAEDCFGAPLATARRILEGHGARLETDQGPDDRFRLRMVFPAAA